MFIHWGLYSIPARGEWVRQREKITVEDYQQYFDEFNPVDYDPKKWARACKQAGMQYAVLTAKHHDGFCLFDTKLTDYNSVKCCGRDLVRMKMPEAFRAEGIRVGLYYSLLDWHHPDYPHYGDQNHPMRDNEAFKDYKYDFDKYLEYMHGQIKKGAVHQLRQDRYILVRLLLRRPARRKVEGDRAGAHDTQVSA